MPDSENTASPSSRAISEVQRDYEERAVVEHGQELGLPTVDLRKVEVNVDLFYIVSKEQAAEALAIPFLRVGKKLRVAVVDPESPATKALADQLRSEGYQIGYSLTSKSGLIETLPQYDTALIKKQEAIENVVDESNLDDFIGEIQNLRKDGEKIANANPPIALNYILVGAMRTAASDIHVEPGESEWHIRLRIDGILQDALELPTEIGLKIVQAIKHAAHMKLNVTERPQDGRLSFTINTRPVDVRVSVLPSTRGESIVMRLLDSGRTVKHLVDLGLTGKSGKRVIDAVRNPRGMIVSTGPTGSGKTTTQYAILRELQTPEVKIITLEDPVEYRVDGIIQSQINDDASYSFADALRAVLRHDPDIIMVGEIRDLPSAEIAAQASLTGHVVLSTLHTNDAVSTIPRLMNMGLPGYVVAPALGTVIAQRLVRRICKECRVEEALSEADLAATMSIHASLRQQEPETPDLPTVFPRGVGCDACAKTGFKGQVAIYEVLHLTREMESAILANDEHALITLARADGMLSLREDGLTKVLAGITTIGEVLRVTMDT